MPTPLEAYLRELRETRSTGLSVKETSFYPALRDLLSAVGAGLKPRVRCTLQLGNQGAGFRLELRGAAVSTPLCRSL